ncbi:MAG TPA: 2-oxoacid:acceptor oxidoreductase subunit alpha, partial [Paludibacter sp.]|nr:2-oxoacid:acceptor oxidoreductase subunit alpha [Paludibacter sp.]
EALNHQRMVDARQAKVNYVVNAIPDLKVEGSADADLLVIGWGSTYGHLKTAVLDLNEQGKKVALAHFTYINPLPKNTAEVITKYKKVVVCELNGGQFATLLRTKVPGREYLQYNKVQGQPFSSAELEEHISSLLK